MKCPNCGSRDTVAQVSAHQCHNCGVLFNSEGVVPNGPDASTRERIASQLAPRGPEVVGNLADLQRAGAAAAKGDGSDLSDGVELPAGVTTEQIKADEKAQKAAAKAIDEAVTAANDAAQSQAEASAKASAKASKKSAKKG